MGESRESRASALAPVIRVRDLAKFYKRGPVMVRALSEVSFDVREGEFISIMGASGSGKSTLLHVLGCLHQPTSGEYTIDGVKVDGLSDRRLSSLRNSKIGVVFQQFNLLPSEDIVDNVALPLVYAGIARPLRRKRASDLLCRLGLGDRLEHKPNELSGGQMQRVAIARSLVNNPAIVLADEPTGNLDSESGREVMAIFQKLNRLGRTVIQVTHDREKADYSGRIIHISDGRVARIEVVEKPLEACDVELTLETPDSHTSLKVIESSGEIGR